jgi:hypothetical protein
MHSQLYLSRLGLAKLAKLNCFKTPWSVTATNQSSPLQVFHFFNFAARISILFYDLNNIYYISVYFLEVLPWI